jgi:hypothetical protein
LLLKVTVRFSFFPLHKTNTSTLEGALLTIIIPTLIGLLQPTDTTNVLHTIALQVLLKLASTAPEFKQQVLLLSEFERQQLETSVKLSVAQTQQAAAQAAASTVKTAAPLKFDFTKYN